MTLQIYLLITIPIILFVPLLISRKAYKLKKKEYASLLEMDITLEEMEDSEKRIENFIKDNKLKEPSSIEEFSKILNVEAGGTEQGLKSQLQVKALLNLSQVCQILKRTLYLHMRLPIK